MKRNIFFVSILLHFCAGQAQNTAFPSLEDLDRVVAEQQKYVDIREGRISDVKSKLRKTASEEERYQLKNFLFNEYSSYVVDSALHYAQEKLVSAYKMNRQDYIDDSRLNMAYVLIQGGMYKEASDILQNINRATLAEYLEKYYFHIYNTLYEAMVKYTIIKSQSKEYRAKAMLYKDSIMQKNDSTDVYIRADRLLEQGDYSKGLQILLDFYRQLDPDNRDVAYVAYSISDFYRRQGNREEEKKYLIVSAMADMKWAVKEYISLRRLATILYEEGDINRAYIYMRRSLDDATFCNARLRTIEVTQTLPIIDNAYQVKTKKEKKQMMIALACISILSVFLIGLVIYVRRQIKKLSAARSELNKANERLRQLNVELNSVNEQLQSANKELHETNHALSDMNQSLSEANNIKELYITKFMTECSSYIDKMDNYRRMLNKKAASGKLEDLFKTLKSSVIIKEEVEAFYNTFDETFLHLFPSFVESFNSLLPANEPIVPKQENHLTTELRIFALIRLGITDSERIASFLRYSKATIYSYRSRLRLKSLNPEHFEENIMQITSF